MSMLPMTTRREMLKAATCGFGYLAFAGMCQAEETKYLSPLSPKQPHFAPKAKRVIFMHMRGGPAHMDTFEYKPELNKRSGEAAPKAKNKKLVGSKWEFKQRGESGLWVSELMKHTAKQADDLCILAGMHTDIGNHTPAMLQLHTGSFAFSRPSMGSWVMYGLGTENENLPGFISLCPPLINGGTKNFGSSFLPAVYQGLAIGDIKTSIKDAKIQNIANSYLKKDHQRSQIDFIQSLNKDYAKRDPADTQVDGIIESYERAFYMQSDLPEVLDLSKETEATLEMYGIGDNKKSDNFGRQCLMARRLAEAGVRYIEICDEFWDQHSKLISGHQARAASVDQPTGALILDLKQRGLLEDTLIVWGGEFGRTADTAKKDLDGRDHNPNGYMMMLAGGGTKGGMIHGGTDELGYAAESGRTHLHDLHATVLHLMGLDHKKLTYRYAGRDFRLTDVYGNVINEVIS